jgi:hypothetical protein
MLNLISLVKGALMMVSITLFIWFLPSIIILSIKITQLNKIHEIEGNIIKVLSEKTYNGYAYSNSYFGVVEYENGTNIKQFYKIPVNKKTTNGDIKKLLFMRNGTKTKVWTKGVYWFPVIGVVIINFLMFSICYFEN